MFASGGITSLAAMLIVWPCSSVPPSASSGSKPFLPSSKPKRNTLMLPGPPIGLLWQLAQLVWLKIGPRPSLTWMTRVKSARPFWKRVSSAGERPLSGAPIFGCGDWAWREAAKLATTSDKRTLVRMGNDGMGPNTTRAARRAR